MSGWPSPSAGGFVSWPIWSADISSAFLQGDPLPETLYCELPKEAECGADEVLEIYVCVYGLGDGPKRWNKKFTKDQKTLGAKQLRTDPCLFCFYKDKDGKLSQAEMASTMEKANAAAKARGEQEFDFFEKLDVDNDGFVDRGEADEFFKMMGLPTGKEEL